MLTTIELCQLLNINSVNLSVVSSCQVLFEFQNFNLNLKILKKIHKKIDQMCKKMGEPKIYACAAERMKFGIYNRGWVRSVLN